MVMESTREAQPGHTQGEMGGEFGFWWQWRKQRSGVLARFFDLAGEDKIDSICVG
jgi:hypothetical protein